MAKHQGYMTVCRQRVVCPLLCTLMVLHMVQHYPLPVHSLGVATSRLTDGIEGKDTTAEYCASESFDVGCDVDEAILMKSALYGRMQPGRCISAEYDHSIGCYSDVLHYMDSQCSGRQKCKILIATLEAVAQPCQKDFKSYLQGTFRCVKVNAARSQTCTSDDIMALTAPTGIIAGGVTHEMPELLTCRWAIQVKSGQAVALTLFSFDLITLDGEMDPQEELLGVTAGDCAMQVSVHERQERIMIDVCNVRQREREIYQSENHVVHVEVMVHRNPRRPRFMIKYRATGCPDIEANGDTWMNRRGDHLFIRCNETNETWFLTCREDRWIGEMGNCTTEKGWTSEKVFGGNASFHRAWIVFAIIIGVVIGLLVGTSLLTIALMWRKRNRDPSNNTPPCSIEDTCGPQDVAMLGTMSRTSYPALLRQEKHIGTDVSEYTHVWDVQAPVICQDALPHHLHTCKLLGSDLSTYGNKELCKMENTTNMNTLRDGNSFTGRSGESGYESPSSTTEDKPNVIPKNIPVYYDVESSQQMCPHGHTFTRLNRNT